MANVITYGTFDTFHWGHIEILRRAREMAGVDGKLIVGLSTDEFNKIKNKKSFHSFDQRKMYLSSVKFVDLIIAENSWEQKFDDIKKYKIDILVMGDDWKKSEQFADIKKVVKTEFLTRTKLISSTDIREVISQNNL